MQTTIFTATFRRVGAVLAVGALALAGCSSPSSTPSAAPSTAASASADSSEARTLTVLTHESFNLDKALLAQFEKDNNAKVEIVPAGDGGELVNKLALTKDAPLGDVVYGVDNTFASRALAEGVVTDAAVTLPAGAEQWAIEQHPELVPIDMSDVCINVDLNKAPEPRANTLEDFTKPEYRGQLVALNPATSSPGLAFLLATVGHFGADGFAQYWKDLAANDVKITPGWSEAFSGEYSGGDGEGQIPYMVSYASSPSYSVNEEGTSSSAAALLDTCFRQVEYAGVLQGAKEPELAKAFIEFMLSTPVQENIPVEMYVYPVSSAAKLPEAMEKFGQLSPNPIKVSPDDIEKYRQEWIATWTEAVGQ